MGADVDIAQVLPAHSGLAFDIISDLILDPNFENNILMMQGARP